jgi:hypothetical protein
MLPFRSSSAEVSLPKHGLTYEIIKGGHEKCIGNEC